MCGCSGAMAERTEKKKSKPMPAPVAAKKTKKRGGIGRGGSVFTGTASSVLSAGKVSSLELSDIISPEAWIDWNRYLGTERVRAN